MIWAMLLTLWQKMIQSIGGKVEVLSLRCKNSFLLVCMLLSGILLSACGKTAVSEDPEVLAVSPEPSPEPTPEPTPTYDLNFQVGGQSLSPDMESLDLTTATSEEIDRLISVLPGLPHLMSFELGSAAAESPQISWSQLRSLVESAPKVEFNYQFTIQNVYTFHLSDEILNLNHIVFQDEGALAEQIAHCMPNLRLVDMDSCGVSNESMARIRDSLPGVDVVWRVWFGSDYTVRTDEERILASSPGRGGDLVGDAIDGLFYCTKVKYLDLGHNDLMSDISFVENMPDLEVLIISMSGVKDISPLANCPKLNYLEFATSGASDLSPLAGLTMLKDINICYDFALCDIRPLYGLDLDRLWIGCLDPIPKAQINEYKRLHPNCVVNTTTLDPTAEEWRKLKDAYPPEPAPRYAQLYEEFQYGKGFSAYAYCGNDPREYYRFEY